MRGQCYDTVNLRHNADFEVLISRGLYWVPFNRLGRTRYTNQQMKEIVSLSPLQKQKAISNIYEAIQLFQASKFKDVEDVWMIKHNDFEWEYHKPGYDAVESNYGCCSSIASWFRYILQDCYENKGHLYICRPDGSGHIINYIYLDKYFYIFDGSTMTLERAGDVACETGSKVDYIKSKYATGIFMKTDDLGNFVKYHSRIQMTRGFEHLYLKLEDMEFIPPVKSSATEEKTVFYLPEGTRITQLNETKGIFVELRPCPDYSPNWSEFRLEV